MTILEYYRKQQQNIDWLTKFQSTSTAKSGKTFSYINTNFREISAFFDQTIKFSKKNGLERNDWNDFQKKGQEKDKHRVINLLNAGFYKFETNCYLITPKGLTLLDLANVEKLNSVDKWLFIFLLLLDYKTEDRDFDILKTTKIVFESLNKVGLTDIEIMSLIKKGFYLDSKYELFEKDIFWLVSFVRDPSFLEIFLRSSENDKRLLFESVEVNSKIKNSTDLIAHKYKSGGVYTSMTFVDDLKVLYFTKIVLDAKEENQYDYLKLIIDSYVSIFPSSNRKFINAFIKNHLSIFAQTINKVVLYKGGR